MKDSESGTDEGSSQNKTYSLGFHIIARLALPTAILIFSVNYVHTTYGRLALSNLQYPYLVVGILAGFTIWIYVEEIIELYNMEFNRGFQESILSWLREWRIAAMFVFISILYIGLLDIIGFFSSSFLGMTAIMYSSGVRNYKVMIVVTIGMLILIYIVFVEFVSLSPPDGLVDNLII